MIYTFKCNNCNHEFEKEIKPSKVAKFRARCPKCGKSARKLINKPIIQFKGDGWGKDK